MHALVNVIATLSEQAIHRLVHFVARVKIACLAQALLLTVCRRGGRRKIRRVEQKHLFVQERVKVFRCAQRVLLLAHSPLYARLVLQFVQREWILGHFLIDLGTGSRREQSMDLSDIAVSVWCKIDLQFTHFASNAKLGH